MSTYCRITGKSRGLPKPNYFPLLPPISPADAKRLCRITGKSYGLPSHHFIPVLVGFTKHSKTPCHITANADHAEVAHVVAIGIKHTVLKNYRYVFPVLESNPDLVQMLESKSFETINNKYVYTVDERRCSLVFPSKLEAAVRDGDVRDIMLAAHTDTLLLKLRKGGSVEVDVKDMSVDDCMELYEGEGPSQEVLQKRRKRANKTRGDTNDWRRKIFEDKERQADYEEERMSEIKSKRIKVKLDAIKETPHMCNWNNVREGLIELHADPELDQSVAETILQFGQQDLQNFLNISGVPIINTLPQCLKVQTENVDLSVSIPGIIKQPIISGEQVTGFPIGAVIAPFQPLIAVTDEFINNEIQKFNSFKDTLKEILIKQFDLQVQYGNILPPVEHIHNLAKQLENLIGSDNETRTEFGVKLVLENGPMYVPGHFFNSPSGETFVPGNIIETSMGPCFIAGISVNTPDGVKFLPGRIVKDNQQPVFVAGQMAVTREGEKFVQGQMVRTKEGPKFIPGQTVITSEGVKFVPGQVIQNVDDQGSKFIPGQTVMTPEGPQFVTGQFTQSSEEIIFVPGQAVLNENYNWEFIPGKNLKTEDGTSVFIPGKEIVNEQGVSQFVPGRMIIENGSVERFLPGLTVDDGNGNMRFVPGMQLETPEGIKFVEGMMLKTDDSITFAVGKVSSSGVDCTTIEFSSAKTTDDIVMHDMISNFGMCFSSALVEEGANEAEVFGHMIQSTQGVEFFPGDATGLPAGKQIPGKLIKGKEIRFIPGTMIDNKFIPGQFVTTESEEKFIPGQVIETNEGPKFVPGQVLQTKSGPKFVPGQTMETEDGPKFIPGQIIETKSGPTFIPGQVIYTEEEGSRFVPGQVVDTIEGPRFVPGRVVETGDHVTFIPGQIVETEDGLKFIAPDLEDDLEGGYQFTVQGFEVAQEELKMIQRNSIPNACFFGEMAIDSQTLQHLAQAGMVVGRQLPVDVPAVNIKSFPTTEAACKLANKLNVDTLYSAKLSHILSTLLQARQSGVPLISEEVGNKNMMRLLNIALECNSNATLLDTLNDAIEDIIQQDMAAKLNTIDTLHIVSIELAAKVRDQKPDKALLLQTIIKGHVEENSEVVDKLMIILNGHKTTMSTALHQMSQHNPKFIDEVLKNVEIMLRSSIDMNDEDAATEILAEAIIKTLDATSPLQVEQALNTNKNDSLHLLVKSCKVATNLDVDPIHSVKLSQIMSALQHVCQSGVALTNGEVGNTNMVKLLNKALECDSNADLVEMLGGALEGIIKHDKAGIHGAIDALHKVGVKLVTKVKKKRPNKVLLLKNVIRGDIDKNGNAVNQLLVVLNNYEPTVCNSFQHMCQQNPEIVAQVLEKVTDMLKGDLDIDNENKATEILYRAIVETVTKSNDLKIQKAFLHQQTQHGNEANNLKMFVKSCELVDNLGLDALQSVKLNNILTTLEQVRQSGVVVTSDEVLNRNLLQLLNIAVECDSYTDLLSTVGDALKHIITQNEAKNVDIIDALHKASFKLAKKVHNKKPNKALLLKNVIKGSVDKKSDIVEKLAVVLNDYEPTICNAFQDICQQNPEFVDQVLKKAIGMLDGVLDMNDENKAAEILYQAVAETITDTKDSKIQQYLSKAQNMHGDKCSDVSLLVKSCELANKLGVDALQSIKLDHILSTLQQVRQSNVDVTSNEVADKNLMHLLNIALECDSSDNISNTLCEALQDVIKGNKAGSLNAIDALHSASIKLAAKVHDKKPNKILLLRNIIKGNVKEKSEVVDKFTAILNDYNSEISAAFQQMVHQNPEFVDKVLKNINVSMKGVAKMKNEKEASEILCKAIMKAINETSDSKIQQVLHNTKSSGLHLLVKSCKVANNLDVDTPYSVKLHSILSSLQQVCESNVVLSKEEVGDKKLMKLLNLALETNSNANLVDTLADALEDSINQDKANKLNAIDALHILGVELAAKVKVKKPDKALLLRAIIKGNVRSKPEAIDKLMTVFNDHDITIRTAFQHMSQQNSEFIDRVIKNASVMLQNISDINDEDEASEILVQAVVQTMAETSPLKIKQVLNNDENGSLHLLVESCKVANNLNLDVKHSVKLNNILSTLQQVCQSGVALNIREVGDENLMQLLNIALECDSNADLSILANALEDLIKRDKASKFDAIDSLHKVSVKLAAKVQNKKPNKALLLKNIIKGNVGENADVVDKLMIVLNDYQPTVCKAFQHMSQQNPEFVEQVIEKVSKVFDISLDSNNENKAMEILYKAIVETISETSDSKIQQSLLHEHSKCDSRSNDLDLLVKSCKLVSSLGVDALQSLKLNQILSTLEQVCQSGVIVTSKEVADKNLMHILSKALDGDSNNDLLDTLSDTLECVIKQSKASNLNVIEALHTASIQLATKVDNKKPNRVLLLQNIIKGNVKNQSEAIDKLMTVVKDCDGAMSIAFQQMAQNNPEFVEKVLENAKIMMGSVVDTKKENEVTEILCEAIVKAVNETKETKIQLALHSNKNDNLHSLIKSCKVACNLNVDAPHSVKLHLILSTLQQVCQSNVALSSEEVGDKKLMQLMNKALESDSKDHLLETLGNALEEVIKQDRAGVLNSIDALHEASIKLGANVSHKKPNKALLLKNVIKENADDEGKVRDKLVSVLKDYENSVSIAFQQMSEQSPEFVDTILKNVAIMLKKVPDMRDEEEAMNILYKAVVKTVNETSDSEIKLALLGQQAVHGYGSDDLQLLVESCKVAGNLDVDAPHSIKLNHILSSLQQVYQSSVPLTIEDIGDEKLMRLLKIASECDTNTNLLSTLGSALEDIINGDIGVDKLKSIDHLHTSSVELAAKIHDKEPSKVLLLKNMIKNPLIVKKSGMIDRLITVLNEHDTTVSIAFQQMSEQNPEFVGKVLENAAVMLKTASNTTDENEAVEILHQAILKTVSETSKSKIKKVLNSQQALYSEKSNDLQILFESCKVAGNLELDSLHSTKISHLLSNLQQISQSSVSLTKEEVGNENIMSLLKLALECDTNTELLENMGDALEAVIKQDFGNEMKTIDDLHALSVKLTTKVQHKKPNKALLLRNMIKDHQKEDKNLLMKRLITMLNDHETTVCVAFQHMCQQDSEFVDKVLENAAFMLKTTKDKENEKEAMEILHKAIIKTVAETSESRVQEAIYNKKGEDFHLLVTDAINLAKALGMGEVVTILNEVLKDRNSMQVLAKDTIVMEVLKRLTVMRQLAESRPNLINALKDLHSDPYAARSDPRLRELVRESAMLMVIPEESLIKSSADIPSSIMFSDNCLAVEDFMVKTRQCGNTFLILKKGIQAVIPREAAKDVLTGRVPYTMLDENGIHYFKPLHVFNALKLPRVATNRFHNYTYVHPALLDGNLSSGTRGSSISEEDLCKTMPNGHGHHSSNHTEGMEEEFVLVKDFITDDEEFYADKGERVKVLKTDDDDPTLMEMEVSRKVEKTMLLDCSTARYKMSIRPPRKHADARLKDRDANVVNGTQGLLVQIADDPARSGLVPMDYLKKVPSSRTHTPDSALHSRSKKQEAKFNREVCIGELIETEEEFGKDISRVVESYLTPLEEELRPAPRSVMDNKDTIFNNLYKISAFHNGVMIAGVKYFLKEPKTIGRTLLRLERYFDEHAQYVKNEPDAQELLEKNEEIQNYFDDLGQELGDDKSLSDHLKLPIQRINDYTLLLQELIKYSKILGEDITDLERALELMLWIPTRCNDLKFITNIEGFHGNIHKLGRLIRHNWFLVKDKNSNRGRERYCFLFKARLLICKVRRISEDRCVFVLKEIIKLPEVDVKNNPTDKRSFEIHHKEGEYRNYPYTFTAHEDDVKPDWIREIQEHAKDPLTLAEHTADDLKLQSQAEEDLFEPLKGVELDISPDIEQGLDPIEKRLAHKPLKHVPEPKRPPLVIPKKRTPIFVCEDPSPSPEREPEPVPEPEPEPEMFSSYTYEEYSYKEEVVETVEEPEEEIEEVIEFTGKRKPKYIPGVSRPLFHSTIRGSSNEPGENAVFECEVEGVTSMTWLKDNRPLSDRLADRISITQEGNIYRLEIKNVCETDSGTYTARAENDQGVSYSTAHLIVEKLSDEEKKARAKATSPVFLVQLKDAELLESTHARFLVKVNGNPIPEIQFYKGDQLITADNEHIEIIKDTAHPGFYEMVIAEVRPEDAGEYRCVASNKYSDEECSCLVTVTSEKDIFAGLQDDLSGGIPKFMWLKNGKPFLPEERFKVIFKDEEDSLALVFQNVKPEDAGLYTCVASTSHGKISCSAELTIKGQIKEVEKLPKKAKIESITKTFEGNVGSTTVIEVKATGDPLPQIRWFRDGEEIVSGGRFKVLYEEESEAASLVIRNLCLEDTGEYNIVAKNTAGSDSQFVNLSVKAPPKITKKLQDFTGLTGKELNLTIQVEASPKPIVQWYKDGMMIQKSNRFKYVTDEASDSYTLVIENATMDDAGLYSVVASNEFCQVSDRCHVSMESPPQFVSTITKELETLEGDYVSFTVTVEGDPLPAVKWKFNGKEIKHDGKHYKISSEDATFTLLISEVDREDAGLYSCEISNQWGSNECDGHLYVKCLPRFDKDLEDKKVKEGDMDVEFTLKLNSFPKATVKWFHDEAEITSKRKEYTIVEEGDTLKLIIKEATTKMSGIYKCRAENEVGFKETSASLSVCTYPKFKKELSDVDVKEGETLKLTIQCQGVPEPEVKWFKDGEELYSDSRIKISRDAKRIENYHLTITLIRSEDGGEYEVRATNEMGTAVTKSLVTVLASTNHSTLSRNERSEEIIPNGDQEVIKTEVEECKVADEQVKDEVIVKLPLKRKPSVEKLDRQESNKSDRTPLRKRLSSEAADEETFSVRELRSEEFVAAAELKPSSFGVVEEPPENEHYIKINISRGVSIVSISEDENAEEPSATHDLNASKKSTNVYELNEEDELNLEMNEKISRSNSREGILKRHHSKTGEDLLNEINRKLSAAEGENKIDIISYDSSRKSSVIEETDVKPSQKAALLERQQSKVAEIEERIIARKSSLKSMSSFDENARKPTKAVSFDEQPSRIIDSGEDDGCEELFKRIQAQRSILGEILEKQQESQNKELEERRSRRSSRQSSQVDIPEEPKPIVETQMKKPERGDSSEILQAEEKRQKYAEKSKPTEDSTDAPKSAKSFDVEDVKRKSIDESKSPSEQTPKTSRRGSALDTAEKIDKSVPESQKPLVNEPKTPQKGRSFETTEKTDQSAEPSQQPEEKSTPRRFSRSSSTKTATADDSESPSKAETLVQEADEPKNVAEKTLKTPQRGRSVEINELDEKSVEPSKPSEQKPKTPSRGVSQEITDANEVMFEKSDSKTLKVSDLDKAPGQKAEKLEAEKKEDEGAKRTLKRMPTERSSTLESVPDLSMDDEKASKSKRASLAEVKEAKGEYPRILSGMDKDIDTFETLSASFEVVGFGVPRPKAIWYKDGEELTDSKHFAMSEDGDKYKLEITDLKSIDAGVYSVKLENSIGEISQQAKLLVSNVENLRGPKLREPLKNTTVTKRQKGVLQAVFIADPVPDAKWTVNDRDVNAEFNVNVKDIELGLKECTYTMTIPSTELSDTGTYKVKVTNKHGGEDSSASLTIVMEPEIDTFRDLVVPPTMPCTFEVIVKSTPEAKVTWFANGNEIKEGEKFKITSEKVDEYRTVHRLSIDDCSLPDEGEYKITAKNKIGTNSQVASLKLYTEKPSFVKLLEDRTVQDGDLLQMKVRVNGLPKPEVKWYKNGQEIESSDHLKIEISTEGQLSTSLTIDHFSECDIDEYKVTAKNLVGEIETSAKLTMAQIEPSFGEQLKRVTEVSDGEPLEISTKVIGSPIPLVQWFKDGEEIKPENTRVKTSISPTGLVKLNIDKVDLDDCGAYKAVATNPLGKSIANTAVVVNQAPKKPSFIKNLIDVNVVEGEPIKLEVQVAGFPEPKVKWLKDGHQLHPCPQYDFISAPNGIYGLTIERSTIPDLGQYSIVVSNKCGEETSNSVVRVTPADKAPIFQTQLQPTKVVEGYPAKLEVKVAGFPLPKLTWKCNGQPIKIDNDNVKLVQTPEGAHCLLIEKVTKDNAGEYELVASNDIGENSTKAQLTVASRSNSEAENEKPIFLSGLRDTSVDESSVLSMSAPFRGNPIPDVQWFKDGSLLLPDERIHFTCDGYKVGLEIQDVNMGDTGFYSCALKNPYGEDSSAAHVGVRKLYQAPVFTQRFKHQQQLPKHDAKFHCRVTGVPFPSVMWHRNGLPLSNSDKIQIRRDGDVCCLTVFNVNADDEGTYSCIASNRDGTATCEAQLQVVEKIDLTPKQEPPQFMKKIGDCEIYAGMMAKFTACASGVPEPEYEWFLDNIRLHPSDRLEMEKEGSGLVRLKIIAANPDLDTGTYKLRAYNPHGEVFCEAKIIFDSGLETKYRKPVGELYRDFDKFRATGAPLPLADKPIISRMTDRHLTLSWKPSIPISPREPVTYLVEMEEQPNGKWFTARAGIRSCACDIHNLKPFVDYKFRVRVENNYGISDPSPFAITYREKLEPDPPKIRTYLPPGTSFHPDTAHYFPKDFDIERPPHDNYAQAPRFLRQEYDTQYGVKGHNVNLFWFVYGYPKPKMTFYFNDELIEMGGRYDSSYTRNGQATLFINKMLDRDVGVYEAVAVNEHGTARQRVQLRIAEYPEFLKRPEESWVPLRKTCRLEARVIGVPYPEIKWYKDWQPLAPSSRIQIDQVEPDLCILRITDLITKDEGLYSISARNIAGSISTSVYLHVEESDYDTIVGGKKGEVKTRNKKFDDIYDLGDELGRGTQGIVFHAVERNTGKNLAAKVMHGTGDLRKWMTNELDILNHLNHRNIIRPYDSLITSNSFTIIEELGAGGELLDVLTRKTYITEYEISTYIRQLLLALDHMHEFNIAHLGLTPGDLLISHLGGDHLKLTDFGLSRRINSRKLEPLFYGMPEFVAPEVANGEGVNLSADMWSIGVITHLLLTGVSLFRGKHDVDTLDRIKEGRFSIDTDISEDARDFIIKLLMMNSNSRLDVRQALNHRWIKMAENLNPPDGRQINTENLRNYYNHYKDWYSNASCRTWFRRRTFDSAYRDPSRMIYPPGLGYSPAPSPEPQLHKDMNHDHKSWKDRIPSREPLDIDIGLIKNESHYQYGPDTYLLQLRDVDFPVRLREYMKVAKSTSDHIDWQAPVIRERRRFMDVMDEEIDDEQKARINQYGSADIYTLRRLKQEIGARPTAHVEAEAILGSRIDGLPPFFREKPQTIPIEVDKPAELACYAVGSPKPLVQWFKNDLVITENHRIKIFEDNEGRSILRLDPANDFDLGIYKVVARNKFGQTTARARMLIASEPGPPGPPEICDVSDTEILLKWKQPKEDGNTPVLCYGLQILENDKGNWKTLAENIDHEAWLVHDLISSTEYQFRLLAMNKIGWSIPGYPSNSVTTKFAGAEKLNVPHVLRNLQIVCERGKEIIGDEPRTLPDYSLEYKHIQWSEQPSEDKYRYVSEIARGRFSIIVKGIDSTTNRAIVAKLMETNAKTEPEIEREFEIYRMMRHERIAYLVEAFKLQHASVAIFIMEKLQGADVLTYLTSRHDYTEQMVATIITQVLDALQYLHWKGYCHLNLQPDNVVMASVRSLHIKLIDFSCSQHVNKLGTVVINKGPLEYTAPEVLCDEPAFPYSDIWSVGVLTYILLSGVSPFRGFTELETRQNITFVRYRFEHLYKDLSQEALRFLMLLFKRTPTKRPSAEECHEHRWLLPTEYMIKKREKTSYETTKLKKFSDEYHSAKNAEATKSKELQSVIGGRLERSNSIVEELEILNTAR